MGEPIDGPAEVDCSLVPEAPACAPVADVCLDIGNGDGTGQTEWSLQVCILTPPSTPLPAAGGGYGLLLPPIGFCLLLAGLAAAAWVREGRR